MSPWPDPAGFFLSSYVLKLAYPGIQSQLGIKHEFYGLTVCFPVQFSVGSDLQSLTQLENKVQSLKNSFGLYEAA